MNFKKIYLGTLAAAAIALASCSSESGLDGSNGKRGEIQLASLQLDSKVTRSGLAADDGDGETLVDGVAIKPELDSCKLIIMSKTGTYLQTWNHVSDYNPSENPVTVGTYDVTLTYGALEDEGFDKPYYYGSATTTVKQDETSEVSVEATLHNTMVKMKYTDAFMKYFTNYSATIHSEGGKYITFEKDETRAAYVRPGNISIDLSVTKPNGLTGTFEVEGIDNAAARTLYNVTVDVNEGGVGDAEVLISFDDSTTVEPISIKVSDEILAAPAPVITPTGFTPGTALTLFEGNTLAEAPKMQVMARSGLKEVTLTTQSTSLLAQGFPAEIELMSATAEQQAKLAALGFAPAGLWKNPGEFALLDLSGLINHIKSASDGNNTSTFTLQVKDKYSKVCEAPVTVTVTLTPLELSLVSCDKQQLGAGYTDLIVKYNGEDFANKVTFKCIKVVNGQNAYVVSQVSNLKDNGNGTYSLRISLPNKYDANTVQMCYNDKAVSGAYFEVSLAGTLTLSYDDVDVWAKKATVSVRDALGEKISFTGSGLSFYLAEDGTSSASQLSSSNMTVDEDNSTITITNLKAGTKYNVYAQNTSKGMSSNTVSFTTEAATDVPNGGFESTAAVSNLTNRKVQQGGDWSNYKLLGSITSGPNYETYNVTAPSGWATTNDKTASENYCKNKNTWFFAPSVQAVTDVHGGSAAVQIRNIGWHTNGKTPDHSYHADGNVTLYCTHTANVNVAAGKMFLGSYSFAGTSETYNQGTAFTSRPSKIKFYAKYTHDSQDANEYGLALVEVLASDGTTIGTAEVKVGASGDVTSWTPQQGTINYTVKNKKAAKLKLFFTSSNHYDNDDMSKETANIKVTKYTEFVQKAIGAILYVDDVSFEY